MFSIRKSVLVGAAAIGLLACGPAWAGTTVSVSLWDKGADMDMAKDLGFNMGGDMSKATMGIDVSMHAVQAGHVTFEVTNNSKDTIHEMIVARLTSLKEKMPYVANEERVDEDRAGDLGEVSELDPGARGELGVDLKPGNYLLYCNVPGHYAAGMWTVLKVTK
jgi:uncharacterized cupredoxin-like copper-binding protein